MQAFGVGRRFCWVLTKSEEAQKLSNAVPVQTKGLLRRHIWRTNRDHSRLQGFFNVSPPRSQKMPWSKFSSRTKIKKKKKKQLTPGKLPLVIMWQTHLGPYIFWAIYSGFALHHIHLAKSSLILNCHSWGGQRGQMNPGCGCGCPGRVW